MIQNRNIDLLLTRAQFLIDFDFGLKILGKYIHDISMVEAGATPKDLGYNNNPQARTVFYSPDGRITPRVKEAGSIAKITISGLMTQEDQLCAPGMRSMAEMIQDIDANPDVAGIKFDVNSGGGEVTAAVHLYNTVKDLTKPSVAQVHTMASGAYLGLLPVDEIIALSSFSQIGSIGVVSIIDLEFVNWYKENMEEIYSSKSPEKNDAVRAYLNGDRSKMIKGLDKLADEFHSKVVLHRELNPDYKAETLKGNTWLAKEAKTRGLIDSIGTEAYATKRLFNYIKLKSKEK